MKGHIEKEAPLLLITDLDISLGILYYIQK